MATQAQGTLQLGKDGTMSLTDGFRLARHDYTGKELLGRVGEKAYGLKEDRLQGITGYKPTDQMPAGGHIFERIAPIHSTLKGYGNTPVVAVTPTAVYVTHDIDTGNVTRVPVRGAEIGLIIGNNVQNEGKQGDTLQVGVFQNGKEQTIKTNIPMEENRPIFWGANVVDGDFRNINALQVGGEPNQPFSLETHYFVERQGETVRREVNLPLWG